MTSLVQALPFTMNDAPVLSSSLPRWDRDRSPFALAKNLDLPCGDSGRSDHRGAIEFTRAAEDLTQ